MPSWSPDGDWVCFVTWDEMGGHLWIMRSDGTEEPKKISKKPSLWIDPVWTPSGSSIVAIKAPLISSLISPQLKNGSVPNDADLVLMSIDSGLVRTLSKVNGHRKPHFGPTSDKVFLSGKTLISICLLYTSPSPRDYPGSRMPSSA